MSKGIVKAPLPFPAMQTDLQVSMDDVVSAFVSQYETNLYERKKALSVSLKEVAEKYDGLEKSVHAKVTGDSFAKHSLPFGLEIKVGEGDVIWAAGEVRFTITISPPKPGYRNTIDIAETKPIPAVLVKAFEALDKKRDELNTEFGEVLVALKSMDRKERQVRGRIAIRKLQDNGYADLMKDEEFAKLVQLSD